LNQRGRAALLFLALAMLAAAFRFPQLAARPMHADEAVHADKLGVLLEQGRYQYSTADYHGPTLYYLALVAARAQGITSYADLNEITLRAVPAAIGVLLVAAHFLLIPYLGLPAAACAALFTAVSPAMVYYSRYFIHETLMVFFTFCALLAVFAYFRRKTAARAAAMGALFGLMYATKETWIIPAACMAVAACFRGADSVLGGADSLGGALWATGPPEPAASSAASASRKAPAGRPGGRLRTWGSAPPREALAALGTAAVAALVVAMLLMSSFLTHARGIVDSVLAYRTYFARASGINTFHVHPWHFYFDRLLYFHTARAPVWSEALIAGLATLGLAVSLRRPGVARFLAIYTVLMAAVYCAIPYKAPWNLLGFLDGMILLAGIGAVWLVHRAPRFVPKMVVVALVAIGVANLGWQARAASFEYAADPRNPWVYAHTGTDVFLIAQQMEALAAVHPAGHAMPVEIVTRENLWPLPWYFRRYPGVRWWNGVSETAPLAPVILATPDMEPALLHRIYEVPPPGQREMYVNMFDHYVELRPRVEVRGYVAKSLWDDLRETP